MKKGFLIIVFLLLGLSLTGIPRMAEGGGTDKSELMIPKKFIGEVVEVDPQTKTVSVRSINMAIAVICDEKTIVRQGTGKKTFGDIKPGKEVTVRYVESDGKYIARSIALNP